MTDLMSGHSRRFGSPEAVTARLPATISWTATDGGAPQRGIATFDQRRFRAATQPGNVSFGIDGTGPWTNAFGTNVRLVPGEEAMVATYDWIVRRRYVRDRQVKATCQLLDGRPLARVSFARPELGDPELWFDLGSSTLVGWAHRRHDPSPIGWTEPDGGGVRWPVPLGASATGIASVEATAGLRCFGADGVTTGAGEACLAPTPTVTTFDWPAAGSTRARLDMAFGVPLVSVHVGGRDTWAVLDSGADYTLVDAASSPLSDELGSHGRVPMTGVSGSTSATIADIDELRLGALRIGHLRASVVRVPGFAQVDPAPELALGVGVFQNAAIRLDFARGEIVFAKDVGTVVKPGARALAFRLLDSLAAEVRIGGEPALAAIDTGTASALSLYPTWPEAHGLPGSRPVLKATVSGLGSNVAAASFFLAPKTTFGAIDLPAVRAHVVPTTTGEDGIVGAPMLAACAAVTFDFAHRSLWLEPPCNRGVPDDRGDMHIEHSDTFTVNPWVVAATLPGGSADRAGIRAGDRLLEVSGKPARADNATATMSLLRRPPGTRIPLVVDREGERRSLTMTLWDPP